MADLINHPILPSYNKTGALWYNDHREDGDASFKWIKNSLQNNPGKVLKVAVSCEEEAQYHMNTFDASYYRLIYSWLLPLGGL